MPSGGAKFQPYAIFYKDGLLSLQAGADTDPSHGEVLGKWAWDGSSHPWYDKLWRSGNTAEVDFVFEQDGRIIPVEVKSADNTMAKSYRLFCKRYGITRVSSFRSRMLRSMSTTTAVKQ